jgi:predicted ATPase
VRHVDVHTSLPDEIVSTIAQRTDGVPLFTEEVTKAVGLERSCRDAARLAACSGNAPGFTDGPA